MNHLITARTPLAPELLAFRSLNGTEALSSLYEFEVELVSPSASLDMNALLGKPLTLDIVTSSGALRHLGGQIARCVFSGRETGTVRSYVYTVTLRPWLWYLTQNIDCRIFQQSTAVDMLRQVFGAYGFQVEERLLATYRRWDYCVQYQESDFAFVSRLMEQEGLYYFFRHEADQQVLVLADDIGAHDALPGHPTLPWLAADRLALPAEDGIDAWHPAVELRPGAYAVDDYDFRKPQADLSQVRANPLNDTHGGYGRYQWLGGYTEADQGEHYARVRLEADQATHARVRAHTRLRALAPGYLFTLRDCPRLVENRTYLIVGVTYRLQEGGYATGSSAARYEFDFVAQPASLPYRASIVTPVPKATGPHTAVVVGPAGQELWTDSHGRVKLQFRWDRYGKRDENSSCWVRVSSAWAGAQFGGIHVPRIGQEVVVDFLNGELDRPIVTGRLYNADQMPPFSLPEAATQSGFVTPTPGGTTANANMLQFEDKRGAERLSLHAERDYALSVEKDASHDVGGNKTETVAKNTSTTVGGDKTTAVSQNTSTTVGGDSSVSVRGDATSITLGTARSYTAHQISVVGTSIGFVGSSVSTTGSAVSTVGSWIGNTASSITTTGTSVSATGSSISNTGSSISSVGSSISSTGSSISNTGSSVSTTGVSLNHVGLSITF
nr:Actin cross-linking toxin VgrG1 [Paraburkholderia busanensis]